MTTCEDLVKSLLATSSLHISLLKVSFYMQMGTVNSPTGKNGHFDSNGLFIENEGGRSGGQCEWSINGNVNSGEEGRVYNMDPLVFYVKTVNAAKLCSCCFPFRKWKKSSGVRSFHLFSVAVSAHFVTWLTMNHTVHSAEITKDLI